MISQTQKLYDVLLDGKPHRTDSLLMPVYGGSHLGLARVAARINDIKNKHSVTIKGWHDKETPSLYWYQMVLNTVFNNSEYFYK